MCSTLCNGNIHSNLDNGVFPLRLRDLRRPGVGWPNLGTLVVATAEGLISACGDVLAGVSWKSVFSLPLSLLEEPEGIAEVVSSAAECLLCWFVSGGAMDPVSSID